MDIRIPLAIVLVTGGLVGLVVPMASPEDSAPAESVGAPGGGSGGDDRLAVLAGDARPATWEESVRIDREADGHFYADVSVDGVPARMLVDTGASVVALTGDDAAAMGLYWDPGAIGPVAQGASGTVYGIHTRLAHVTLGNFEARDVDAMIIPEGLGISLLGQSFLSSVRSVQIEGDAMVLEN